MFSIKGIFANNTIHLQEPLYLTKNAKVVVTPIAKTKTISKKDLEIASKLLYEMEEKKEFDLTPVDFELDETKQNEPSLETQYPDITLVPSVDFASLEKDLTHSLNFEQQELNIEDDELDHALIDSELDDFLENSDFSDEIDDSAILVRQHNRYNIIGTIKIRGSQEEYRLQDYSATGLSFLSSKLFTIDSELQAIFQEEGGSTKVEFPLRIKHITRKNNQYLFGCEFTTPLNKTSPLLQALELLRL